LKYPEKLEKTARELGFQEKIKEMQLLAIGPFKDVRLFYQDAEQIFNKETTKKIEDAWKKHLEKRPNDFPGTLAHTQGLNISKDNQMELLLQKTRYDMFIGTREPGKPRILPQNKIWGENYSLPFSFGAVTITNDNAIVCGLRGKTGLESNLLTTLPSGYFNPEVHVIYPDYARGKKEPSLLALITTELREELGLEWFQEIKPLGIMQDCNGSQQPLMTVRIKLALTSNEVREKFKRAGKEIEKIVFLNNNLRAIRKIQEEGFEWTGHDYGKLLLHFALLPYLSC